MADKEFVLGNKVKDLLVYTFLVTKPVSDKTLDVRDVIRMLETMQTVSPENRDKLIQENLDAMKKSHGKQGFPKSAVHTYINEMRQTAVSAMKNIHAANECAFVSEPERRIRLIYAALDDCNLLLKLIEISHQLGYISVKRMGHWTKLVTDVKYMALAWKKKDTDRAKEALKQKSVREYELQASILSAAIKHAMN